MHSTDPNHAPAARPGIPSFKRPSNNAPTQHLCVAEVRGVPLAELQALFSAWAADPSTVQINMPAPRPAETGAGQAGTSAADTAADESDVATTAFCYVSFKSTQEASAAMAGLAGRRLQGRPLSIKYAELVQPKVESTSGALPPAVAAAAEQLHIPGLQLLQDFVSPAEEAALLAGVDSQPWVALAKRRVQHYGYAFDYAKRGVEANKRLGPLPDFMDCVLARIQALPDMPAVDQCTVNEYTPGIGLAAHIDTHSAFTGAILSLSLAGPCVMELRQGAEKRALLLPPKSLLVLGGEARYAWQHYIPHRHSDVVDGISMPRAPRRVSLTLRQVRNFPCDCGYPEHCDSQQGTLPPTRLQLLQHGLLQPGPAAFGTEGQEQRNALEPAIRGHSMNGYAASQLCVEAQPGTVPACNDDQPTGNGIDASSLHNGMQQAQKQAGLQQQTEQQQQQQQQQLSSTSKQDVANHEAAAEQLEAQHVHQVYDAIASHFSATRFAVWPKVRAFIEGLPSNSVIADVGCGNGKYFGVRADCAVLGSDMSAGLAGVAARRLRPCGIPSLHTPQADVLVADALQLPYRDSCCDAVLCIAVLHHISSMARRLRLLQELARVLRPGGQGLVTVWATDQEDPRKTLAKWTLFDNPSHNDAGWLGARHTDTSVNDGCGSSREDSTPETAPNSHHRVTDTDTDDDRMAGVPGTAHASTECAANAVDKEASTSSSRNAGGAVGPDYMVPWHLPLHKAGAVLAQAAASATTVALQESSTPSTSCSGEQAGAVVPRAVPAGRAAPLGVLDAAKNAVVLQRYYHLFEPGELEGLVGRVQGLVLLRSYYDRSNWCAIFQRTVDGLCS